MDPKDHPLVPKLRSELGDQGSVPAEDLGTHLVEATALVTRRLGAHQDAVPEVIQDRAVIVAATALWHQRSAPHGVVTFGELDSVPIRTARDPMARAWPILRPFLPGGFA